MTKEEYIKRYGEEAYEAYKKKQSELTKAWRDKNREKSRKYGHDYYWNKVKKEVSVECSDHGQKH